MLIQVLYGHHTLLTKVNIDENAHAADGSPDDFTARECYFKFPVGWFLEIVLLKCKTLNRTIAWRLRFFGFHYVCTCYIYKYIYIHTHIYS